ncbi:glycosyltransferase family 15 protein [Aspergillus affinis]|uniref:glycosyltransferase family 15 protein n=1 Tax=Aspergillus affinis TaxID=1070780 RepID=UPI0022FEEFC7|nr:glycolipid 2-alpha-mannosyltransferase [Aspergillus affinis]KAI9041779.1 glycolipid 2-alpha-mannosyltransferase [Aspergillus affinis]
MAVARPIRMLGAACIILVLFLVFQVNKAPSTISIKGSQPYEGIKNDPLLEPTGEPEGKLWRAEDNDYAPDSPNSARTNAALISLVRNEELDDLIPTMRDLERTWNNKFNYPWIFFNDQPFTQEFKRRTQAETKAKCIYEQVPKEHWDMPDFINKDLFRESAEMLKEKGIQYSDKISYHNMCRWNSGMFYKHPALEKYRYYWRVEPKVQFFCNVDYDVFRFVEDRNITYGFTINLFDAPESIPTLWPKTQEFLAANPTYLSDNNMMDWLVDDQLRPEHTSGANGYSTCHFWSNFEIGDMEFFRGEKYSAYFDYLDRSGGFYYERWGDAPVHSIALGLFADKSKVHWFRDIGYRHIPYFNCPNSPKCSGCTPGKFYEGEPWLAKEDCRPNYFQYVGKH